MYESNSLLIYTDIELNKKILKLIIAVSYKYDKQINIIYKKKITFVKTIILINIHIFFL